MRAIVPVFFMCAVALALASGIPGAKADQRAEEEALVKQLKSLIDEAERGRAADPGFLRELRDAINDFERSAPAPAPETARPPLISDRFDDGDYVRNPKWTVASGQFAIDLKRGLRGVGASDPSSLHPGTRSLQTYIDEYEAVLRVEGPRKKIRSPSQEGKVVEVAKELEWLRSMLPAARLPRLETLVRDRGPEVALRSMTLAGWPSGVYAGDELARVRADSSFDRRQTLSADLARFETLERESGRYTQVRSVTLDGAPRVPVREEIARLRDALDATSVPTDPAEVASIILPTKIPNAFEMTLRVSGVQRAGSLRVGVYQGSSRRTGYGLSYRPGANRLFVLDRQTRGGTTVLTQTSRSYRLARQQAYEVVLRRRPNGVLAVFVDGQRVLRHSDRAIRESFDGIVLTVDGDVAVREISVRAL